MLLTRHDSKLSSSDLMAHEPPNKGHAPSLPSDAQSRLSPTSEAFTNTTVSGFQLAPHSYSVPPPSGVDAPKAFKYAATAVLPSLDHLEDGPLYVLIGTYLSYFILICFGHVRDSFGKVFRSHQYRHLRAQNGYASMLTDFQDFFTRRLFQRIADAWNRPVTGVAGRTIRVLERVTTDRKKTFKLTGNVIECLNLSSYNYLGFAQSHGPCADAVEKAIEKYGVTTGASRHEGGNLALHVELEELIAKFIGVESAMALSMGFATNSTTLPALVSKGCLLISDELNHASLVYGSRLSAATVRVYKHNDMVDLEAVLRDAIVRGQPRTHRPWKKILLVVEGLYSMEGSFFNLPAAIALKKKYKFYIYLDEAHSIGALGPRGKGICDYFGCDPRDVDIMMGTFTKSFGAAGGYVAGKKDLIDYLRLHAHGPAYTEAMSPPVAQQIYTSMRIIMGEEQGEEGRLRVNALARNCRYFAKELRKMGFIVYGHEHSPVIPLLLFNPSKLGAFSSLLLSRGIAVVVVGYPATPIISSRVRFCMSASHTLEDLDWALKNISEVGDLMNLKVSRRVFRDDDDDA